MPGNVGARKMFRKAGACSTFALPETVSICYALVTMRHRFSPGPSLRLVMRFCNIQFAWNVFLVLVLILLATGVFVRSLIYLNAIPSPATWEPQ
jgi:hypothetical protein